MSLVPLLNAEWRVKINNEGAGPTSEAIRVATRAAAAQTARSPRRSHHAIAAAAARCAASISTIDAHIANALTACALESIATPVAVARKWTELALAPRAARAAVI
jgi:hypothetical protein